MALMNVKKIIVASPHGDIRSIAALLDGAPGKSWVYFGDDFLALSSLEQRLPAGSHCIDTVAIYKKTADDIRPGFVRWIDELNRQHRNDIEWWLSALSSRNIYSCYIFQYACYLEILDRLSADKGIVPDAVFVESKGLARDIKAWGRRKNIRVFIKSGPYRKNAFGVRLKPVLDWGRFIVVAFMRCLAARGTRPAGQRAKIPASGAVVMHTFVHDSTVSADGTVKERYLPFLREYSGKIGFQTVIHPMLYGFRFSYRSIYGRMRKSGVHFLIREDFLRLADYISALTYPMRALLRKVTVNDFRSFNLSCSVAELRSNECFSQAMNAVLTYRLISRLRGLEFNPALFILWFENQVIDKALIAGVRRFFPGRKIVGAQIFLHPPNYISLYPSQSEAEAHLSPDLLIETSQYQCQRACVFTSDIPCRPGAGLRYAHVFNRNDNPLRGGPDPNVIMVVLPYSVPESIEILTLLRDTLGHINRGARILVKVHPDCSIKEIQERFGKTRWPAEFGIFNGSLAEALKSASIVVSANSSSMVEAACYGIPVIYAGSRIMIDQNILRDEVSEIIRDCYTPADLADAINTFCAVSPQARARYVELGNRVRDRYFTPVTDQTLSPFFDGVVRA